MSDVYYSLLERVLIGLLNHHVAQRRYTPSPLRERNKKKNPLTKPANQKWFDLLENQPDTSLEV